MNPSLPIKENQSNKLSFRNRIKKRSTFINIQESGRKIYTSHFLIFIRDAVDEYSKLGITVSKKVDKRATVRNKLKRRLKEFFRINKKKFSSPYEIVIIAKKHAKNLDFHLIHKELSGVFYNNKIFINNNVKTNK